MVRAKKIKAGSELEARCTKCKKVTTHVVIAMDDGEIKKVRCLVCEGEHRFYPPKDEKKKTKKKSTKKPKAPKLTAEEKAVKASLTEWRNALEGTEKEKFKPYMINGIFQEGDFINHPTFGKGVVKEIVSPGKMSVLFESGEKKLVFNFKENQG